MGRKRRALSVLAALAKSVLIHESPSTITHESRTGCELAGTKARAGWVVEVTIRAAKVCRL